jgi:transcriptional regulator with XRE-family HTH domain
VAKRGVRSFSTQEYETLISVLSEARQEAGLGRDELSRRLDRSRTYMYNLEHMGRRVDPEEVRLIAIALGLEPIELFRRWLDRIENSET